MTKTTPILLAAGGLAAIVCSPRPASADLVNFSNLPVTPAVVKIPTSSSTAPDKVLATEHVDGVFPALLPLAKRKKAEDDGYRNVVIFTSEKDATAYSTDGTTPGNPLYESTSSRTCMTRWGSMTPRLSFTYRTKPYVPPKPTAQQIAMLKRMHRWPPPVQKVVKPVKPEVVKDTVYSIHLERLSPAGDTVTLESIDAFVDLNTMGSRLVQKSSEKLTRVAAGPNGMGVYAARDEQGKSEFLVTNPDLPSPVSEGDRAAQVSSLASTASRLLAQAPSGSSSNGCGYVRFDLEAKPGTGQMATVLANAFLPPAPDPSDADNAEPPQQSEEDDEGESVREQMEMQARANRSQRSRPVAINVSLSQLTSEPAPLLSVTFGWAGKDQRLTF